MAPGPATRRPLSILLGRAEHPPDATTLAWSSESPTVASMRPSVYPREAVRCSLRRGSNVSLPLGWLGTRPRDGLAGALETPNEVERLAAARARAAPHRPSLPGPRPGIISHRAADVLAFRNHQRLRASTVRDNDTTSLCTPALKAAKATAARIRPHSFPPANENLNAVDHNTRGHPERGPVSGRGALRQQRHSSS